VALVTAIMEGNLEEVKTVYHAIVPDGDLVLELKKSERIFPPPQTGPKTKTVNVAKFRVNRSTMIDLPHESKKSDSVFKVMLTSWGIEARQNTVTVEDDDYEALHVFLRIIHGMSYKELFNVSHKVMWPLVKIFDKYNVSLKPLAEKWFANWYATKGNKIKQISPRELLYPCWKFNHAAGFYKASGDCIYDVKGHITEHNPTEQWGLHLPQRVIRELKLRLKRPCELTNITRTTQRSSWSTEIHHP
jgi:hypothetical protein